MNVVGEPAMICPWKPGLNLDASNLPWTLAVMTILDQTRPFQMNAWRLSLIMGRSVVAGRCVDVVISMKPIETTAGAVAKRYR